MAEAFKSFMEEHGYEHNVAKNVTKSILRKVDDREWKKFWR